MVEFRESLHLVWLLLQLLSTWFIAAHFLVRACGYLSEALSADPQSVIKKRCSVNIEHANTGLSRSAALAMCAIYVTVAVMWLGR